MYVCIYVSNEKLKKWHDDNLNFVFNGDMVRRRGSGAGVGAGGEFLFFLFFFV